MADKFYECGECEEVFEDLEVGEAVYECSRCSQTQVGDRRCEIDHIFMTKIADSSCPYCDAPDSEFKEVTEDRAVERQKEKEQEEVEREERRKNPPPEADWERESREKREAEQAEWRGPDSLGQALRDIPADSGKSFNDDGSVGGKFDRYFSEGSSGLSISIDEAKAICEKVKTLEREVEEWSGE